MHIHWKIERLDENPDEDPAADECLIEIEGTIECDGQTAGVVDASYLYADEPESSAAFMEFWNLDSRTCKVFEQIIVPAHGKFREPIPDFLGALPGILCVHFIALRPQFRRRGLGREPISELIRNFADPRVVGLFPNESSRLRLVTGILIEISEEWETGKVYLQPETKKQHPN